MTAPLKPNTFYHICSRAVGDEKLFLNDGDFQSFLARVTKYLVPAIDIYAYCLIPNHFHLLICTKGELINTTKAFSDCLNSYTKWKNTKYDRKGGLFITPFKRIEILHEGHLLNLIYYIHRNPVHHFICNQMDDWKYSSYNSMFSDAPTNLQRAFVINLFGGLAACTANHETRRDAFFDDYAD